MPSKRALQIRVITALSALLPPSVRASTSNVLRKFRWSAPPALGQASAGSLYPNLLKSPLGGKTRPPGLSVEQVESRQQTVGSAIVAGTWTRSVRNAIGEQIYVAGQSYDKLPADLYDMVAFQESRREEIGALLYRQISELQHASQRFEPKLEIVNKGDRFELNWLLDFINADESRALQIRANSDGRLIGVKDIGVYASDGLGNVFPRGAKRSGLQEVVLSGLDGTGTLQSERSAVRSASAPAAESTQFDFRFEPRDERFDQVQAYFYVEEALEWFRKNFAAQPLGMLQVRVQVGSRLNTALYLRNTIRLGSGDDQRYHAIARDPSIVMHEVGHAFVDRYAGLPSEGEGGSLNEAYADFFAASILDNPAMGQDAYLAGPYVRTLANSAVAPGDLGRGLYKDAQIFAGTLWDLRLALGPTAGETLAFRSLSRLGPQARFTDFAPALRHAADTFLDAPAREKMEEILRARGVASL